jgi:hypothetical protein
MNKRIQELAEQAWDATAVSPDFGHPVSFAEKLSELIIQECVAVADHSVENGKSIIGERIKQHFGIEE